MVRAITELQGACIEVDIWKIEGIDQPEDDARVVATARRGGRSALAALR